METNLDVLRQAASVSPDNVPLLLLLGEGCLQEFLLDEANQHFSQVLAHDPGNFAAHFGLARISYKKGHLSEGIVRAEALAATHPGKGEVWRLLAHLALGEGRMDEARKSYETAREVDPGVRDEKLESELWARKPSATTTAPKTDLPSHATGFKPGPDPDDRADLVPAENDTPENPIADLDCEFERPTITFADLGGMDGVKQDIRMKIIYPLQNAELFRQYGKKTGGGILLYGPPGCGKTMLSRATAGEIKATFLSIGIHQVLDMWLGNSEKNLHKIFDVARKNNPAILFFDEVDALASDRSSIKHGAGRNVINQFLAEMDGATSSNDGILVLGATNAPWQVDSAFRRPGRFDRVVFVPPPDEEARVSIIEIMARGRPITNLDARALARKTKDFSGADLNAVFDVASEEKLTLAMREKRVVPISTDDLIRAAKSMQSSTKAWFETAKNYALYANQSGFYDDVLSFLGLKK